MSQAIKTPLSQRTPRYPCEPPPPPRSGEGEQNGNRRTLLISLPREVGVVCLPLSASGRGLGGGVGSRSPHRRCSLCDSTLPASSPVDFPPSITQWPLTKR